ncbi:tetratricopeptide repeat protein [Ignavibacteria bacterium CHB1]|nr:MAG: hypothetical protein EDM69_01950 [Chlorobiota bacterium]MBV6398089.1 Adaptive-response sensory-kinase SasA [Ignavibacteria bacterium]MCC6886538.1 tetratricopeptide repeat protein [Ignavibacteriales bacterium]MCE7952386.1 hypothetical protein [Chlorobi bacterium CHB7]MDL1886503.1 tetratricopeptide repeat protein [Ignavibacteria bacterium CHB1]RIK48953.1 MAG: hypothetical protein DCC60_05080 [Ignavibacteriota bacterium]
MNKFEKKISDKIDSLLSDDTADRKSLLDSLSPLENELREKIRLTKKESVKQRLEKLLLKVIIKLIDVNRRLSKRETANALTDEALALSVKLNDPELRAEALYEKATQHSFSSGFKMCHEYLMQSLEVYKELKNNTGIARCYMGLGINESKRGKYKYGVSLFNKALEYVSDNSAESQKTRAIIYVNLANTQFRSGQVQKSISNLESAKKIFSELKNFNTIQVVYGNLGYIYWELGELPKAIFNLNKAMKFSREAKDDYSLSSVYGNLGLAYKNLGEFEKSLDLLLKATVLKEKFGDAVGLSTGYMNIGTLYQQRNEYRNAEIYFKKALKMKKEIKDMNGFIECLINLGYLCTLTGNFNHCERYAEQALKNSTESGNKRLEAYSYNLYAKIFRYRGNLEKAIELLEKAQEICSELGSHMFGIENRLLQLSIQMQKRQYAIVEKELLKIIHSLIKDHEKLMLVECYDMLSTLFQKQKNYKKAFEYSQKYCDINKELFNEKRDKNLKQIKIIYDLENAEKEKEIYRLKYVEHQKALDELRELHFQLLEREKQKSEFLAIASHDLRNPLSAIIGLSNYIIEDESITRDEVDEFMHDIINSANSMLSIVKNFLNLEAIEQNEFNMVPEEFNIVNLIDFGISKVKADAERKEITIHKNYPSNEIILYYDKSLVLQIFDNLITNAIKFSPRGGNIYVTLIHKDSKLLLSVKDEGPGLTVEDKQKVFQRYSHLSAKPTGGESSTGLGLSIVKKLITLLNAKVKIKSKPGKGAEFIVEFKSVMKGNAQK